MADYATLLRESSTEAFAMRPRAARGYWAQRQAIQREAKRRGY